MSATSTRRSVSEILAAIKAALEAATWTPTDLPEEPAFQFVKLFDIDDLEKAFQELLASKQRVAFVIADNESFNDLAGGLKMLLNRRLPVAILISDRVHGDRVTALYGGTNADKDVLGAEGLKEIALQAITGQLIEPPGPVICTPTNSTTLHIADVNKKLPGRACLELDVDCTGGTLEARLTTVKL